MNSPLVSIVIPSYKPGHFEQSLRSALGQTYPNIEILVSDNCPTDEIRDICARFDQVIYQRCPVKGVANVSTSLFAGKGMYIKPLFDDDILHPFCVERMVGAMALRADIELVFSASQVIDVDNVRLQQRRPYAAPGAMPGAELYRILSIGAVNVVGELTSIMFKRARLWELGWNNIFRMGGHDFSNGLADAAFYCNLTKTGSAYYLDEELTYFRRDQRLQSNSNQAANPNFGLCISEGIDLIMAAHVEQVISTEELNASQERIEQVSAQFGPVYAQVWAAHARYLAYLEQQRQAPAAGMVQN